MTDCIFCKIISGDIPSYQIYEDDDVLAFLDITQTTKGHTLVVPKKHIRNVLEMTAEDAATLFSKIPEIAAHITKTLGASGMNILQNNETIAGQTVFHAHVHLIPRYSKDDGFTANFTEHDIDLKTLQSTLTTP
ncbi:HIT family protein [Lactococcus laudensis]|uniref:HIT family protein n=1 Tax=Pseudolactococcus laudensis TaxID=1494461 RepID=UPI002FCA14E9